MKTLKCLCCAALALGVCASQSVAGETRYTTQIPKFVPRDSLVQPLPRVAEQAGVPRVVVRVYRDSVPWFGENRDIATLQSLGKVVGRDLFVHSLLALQSGIPANTAVVLISSNGQGLQSAASRERNAAAQRNLRSFTLNGGTLIVDMADNLEYDGFVAPGAVGTPTLVFPDECLTGCGKSERT
ncbi:MAG: hypothetical protein U1E45_24965 [Geminicoccaceae bacterium]